MKTIDPIELRNAFGQFMTGVTVVTTKDKQGEPVGFTANSFSSVSLDPPLLLVCLANGSSNYDTFCSADGFAVNILAEDQTDVSNTFARPVDDRFAAVQWQNGPQGSPVLDGVCAWFDCSMEQLVEAGDHIILIGRVVAFENHERGGLGYASGGYFTRALETEAARTIALDVRACVSAVVRYEDSVLLHGSDADGWHLPVADGPADEGDGQRARLSATVGLALSDFYLYSVYEDAKTKTHHIIYRCAAESSKATEGCFVPLADLEKIRFTDPAEQTMMHRYVSECSMGNFKIYIGNKHDGQMQGD